MKTTPRNLAYADSDKEAPVRSLAKGFSDRFSLESSGTSDTHRQTRSTNKIQKTPSKNKEPTHLRRSRRLEDRSTTKEKPRKERSKSRGKRSRRQEISSDSEHEEGSEDAYEDLNSPYKRPKPTLFTHRITRFKYHRRSKLLRNIRVYEGNKDPEDHLDSQRIKRRQNEGLQAFIDRFMSESLHIKGVPSVLCIQLYEGHGHRNSQRCLMTRYPNSWTKCSKSHGLGVGEVVAGSANLVLSSSQGDKGYVRPAWSGVPEKARNRGGPREARRNMGVYTPYPRTDTFTPLTKTPKEILAMESGWNGAKVINMIWEEGNRKRPFEEGRFSLMNELTFLAIPRSQLTDEPIISEGIIEGNQVRRILVDGGSSSEIMYEHCFRNLDVNIRSRLRRCKAPMIGFSGETYHLLGLISLQVTMGKEGRSKTVLMEFAIIKCYSSFNIIIGRIGMRSLGAVGSTIHSMIIFPIDQGVVMEQVILRARSNSERRPSSGPVSLEKIRSKKDIEEVFTISHECPNQYVTMGATLTTNCKQLLTEDDGKGLSRSKRTKRGNTLGGRNTLFPPLCERNLQGMEIDTPPNGKKRSQAPNLTAPFQDPTEKQPFECIRVSNEEVLRLRIRQVEGTPDANGGGTFTLSKKLQAKSTPTPRDWRLYLGKETIEEGSGVEIILVSPEGKMHLYAIRLKFNASNHVEAIHTPAIKQERKYKEEILDATAPFHRIGNYKAVIPQPGSISRYQNKTIGRRGKKQQEGESDKQCPKSRTKCKGVGMVDNQ
ncbi:hypothetical protein Tco_0528096 [Tanacetum coccineum]